MAESSCKRTFDTVQIANCFPTKHSMRRYTHLISGLESLPLVLTLKSFLVPFSKRKWPCPFNMFKDEIPGMSVNGFVYFDDLWINRLKIKKHMNIISWCLKKYYTVRSNWLINISITVVFFRIKGKISINSRVSA